jgi:predicted nucleic acid-binding protein
VIYLDTSAMVKLVVAEPESEDLIEWLGSHPEESLASSRIGHLELTRVARRVGGLVESAAQRLISMIDSLVLTESIAAAAGTTSPPELRTLDAIHLATALMHHDRLVAFCAYDQRLLGAARAHQLAVVAPGT